MEKESFDRYLNKINESIRNIQYQINSINQDIIKNKKQSYIEKRINRLVNNYKILIKKSEEIAHFNRKETRKVNESLLNVRRQIEDVCHIGSKDYEKQNINLGPNNKNEEKEYISYDDNEPIRGVYGKDGQLAFIYMEKESKGFKEKIRDYSNFKKEKKKIKKNNMFLTKIRQFFDKIGDKKILKKITALGMGALMLLPGTISANQNESKNESGSTKNNGYVDIIKKTPVENNEFVEIAKKTENNKFSDELKTDVGENSNILYEEDKKENKDTAETVVHIIAPAQSKYTEVSDGRGNYGIFTEDTEVSIYNRALVRTNKDGSKSILKATKVGQTWKQYAEEKGIDYDEFKTYIENNENIQEVLSTMSVDGKSIYGWMPASKLEYKIQDKEINVQRNYVTEVEER